MIHLYWHGDPPQSVLDTVGEWGRVAQDDVQLWSPAQLADVVARAEDSWSGVALLDRVRHVANVARWHLLHEYGGVWADTDVAPLRRPNGYLSRSSPWCASLGSVPTPFMCGGPKGHALWARTLAAALDEPQGTSPHASGGRLLQTIALPGELELVPANLFTERDVAGRLLPTPPGGRFTLHEWRTSTLRRQTGGWP